MAASRAAKKINWTKLAEVVPAEQKAVFSAFRIKSDSIAAKIESLPENMRSINWDAYKKQLPASKASLVDEMKKAMESVKVSRPVGTAIADEIKSLRSEYEAELKKTSEASNMRLTTLRNKASRYTDLPDVHQMTKMEVFAAFPEVGPEAYAEEMAAQDAHGHDDHGEEEEFDIQLPKLSELMPKKK